MTVEQKLGAGRRRKQSAKQREAWRKTQERGAAVALEARRKMAERIAVPRMRLRKAGKSAVAASPPRTRSRTLPKPLGTTTNIHEDNVHNDKAARRHVHAKLRLNRAERRAMDEELSKGWARNISRRLDRAKASRDRFKQKYYAARDENYAQSTARAPPTDDPLKPRVSPCRTNKHKAHRDKQRVADRDWHRASRAKGKARARAEENAEKAAMYDGLASFAIKGARGVVRPQVRELVRKLVELGVPQTHTFSVIKTVLDNGGIDVNGRFDAHTARRILAEGLVHSQFQVVDALMNATSFTISQDATTQKKVPHEARFVDVRNPDGSRTLLELPITRAAGHSADEQLQGWRDMLETLCASWNRGAGKDDNIDADELWMKVAGMLSDHATDQRKLAILVEQLKIECDRRVRGKRAYARLGAADLRVFMLKGLENSIKRAGSYEAWEALSAEQRHAIGEQVQADAIMELGQKEFEQLSDEEKGFATLFIWAGCGMHKDLNAFRYGMEAVSDWLDSDEARALGLVPPVPLFNKGNSASANDPTASTSKARAEATVARGAIKTCELAGSIFRNKDAKKGQQDVYRWFFESFLGYSVQFPDTSHVRFGSFGDAAGELLVHLPLYLTFLEHVRDAKETGDFTNLEANVYKALQDPSTLLELAVLAIYAETISKPFMRHIRTRNKDNGLHFGPYYERVIAHCRTLARNPTSIFAPETAHAYEAYKAAAIDGEIFERPEVIVTVQQLFQNGQLPHLDKALSVFFHGAALGWEHFRAEFADGGKIASATPEQLEAAAVRTTNDHCESAFGRLRQSYFARPMMSLLMREARAVHKANATEEWWRAHATRAMEIAARREARRLDTGIDEAKERKAVVTALKRKAQENADERARKRVRDAKYAAQYNKQPVILDSSYWKQPENVKLHKREDLRLQIAWFRAHKVNVKGLAQLPKASMITGLVAMLDGLPSKDRQRLADEAAETHGFLGWIGTSKDS